MSDALPMYLHEQQVKIIRALFKRIEALEARVKALEERGRVEEHALLNR